MDNQERMKAVDSNTFVIKEIKMTNKRLKTSAQDYSVEETKHPFAILPIEMWGTIFDSVTDSRTWLNCFYSSPIFQHEPWLKWKQNRVHKLFPEVLRLLMQSEVLSWATRSEILLKCRKVSKSWRKGTDNLLKESAIQDCHFPRPRPYLPSFKISMSVSSLRGKRCWMSIPCNLNPFLGRLLKVNMNEFDQELKLTVTTILTKFGHHIYNFSCSVYDDPDVIEWYFTVHHWVKLMPNVKKIRFTYHRVNFNPIDDTAKWQLQDIVSKNPFPKLQHLISVKFFNIDDNVTNSVLTSNPQITEVNQRAWLNTAWENYAKLQLPLLTVFSLKTYNMDDVAQLTLANWPLHTLNVTSYDTCVNIGNYVTSFENFKHTLKRLKLKVGKLGHTQQLDLPLLKYLDLRCECDGSNIVELVKGLKALKRLDLQIDKCHDNHRYFTCIENRNILEKTKLKLDDRFANPLFELIPRLNTIIVKAHSDFASGFCQYTFKRAAISTYIYDGDIRRDED